MSKIEAGKMSITENPISILDIVENTADTFYNQAAEKGLEMFSYVDSSIPLEVYGDNNKISQILMNLTINSIKFTLSGHICVRAVLVKETNQHAVIRFSIQDTGVGISEEDQAKLFKPFSQLDNTQTMSGNSMESGNNKGYGLGLSIVDKLVKLMNGTIHVTSTVLKGTEFSFELEMRKLEDKQSTIAETLKPAVCKHLLISTSNSLLASILKSYAVTLKVPEVKVVEEDDLEVKSKEWNKEVPASDGWATLIDANRLPTLPPDLQGNCKVILLLNKICSEKHPENFPESVATLRKPIRLASLMATLANLTSISPLMIYQDRIDEHKEEFELKNVSILVVDDSSVNRKVLKRFLGNIGITDVDTAGDGLVALDMVESSDYHCIFMDLKMPILSGLECTKRIRAMQDTSKAQTPIIAVTANAWQQSITEALDVGCNEVLTKPVLLEDMLDKLRKVCSIK
jgi:two-component system sensor histidine kinase/response regulator